MFNDKKFIIYRRNGKLRAFRFPSCNSHYNFARDNGLSESDVIETGLFVESHISVLECKNSLHLQKARGKSFNLNEYHNLRQAREAESRYSYRLTGLPEGD